MRERKSSCSIKERDKMKKKGMAIALATGIIVGNFPANFTYAETNVIDRLNSEIGINVNENMADNKNAKIERKPAVENQWLYFNRIDPKDVVIKNVNFNGTELTKLSIGTISINISEVKVNNDSITIPKEVLNGLKIDSGDYSIGLEFSNGASFIGVVYIEIVGRDIESTPTIGKQDLSFDRSKPQDMVIQNVDFKGLNLKTISFGGNHVDISTVRTTENTIIIPKEFFINLSLRNGKYHLIFQFENGSGSVQDVTVNITGDGTPVIKEQIISFNRNNPKDVVIKDAYLNGLNLTYIYINGQSVPASSLKVEADKIIIPANVLKSLGLINGVYDMSLKFKNGTTLVNKVYLNVTDISDEGNPEEKPEEKPPVEEGKPEEKPEEKPPVEEGNPGEKPEEKPPVEEGKPEEKPEEKPSIENNQVVNVDNGEKVIFDISKPTNIKIVSSKLENKEVEYILVNGIKVTRNSIEGKITRSISEYATKEYFTTANGSITLSAKLFKDLNLAVKEGYNIGVGFRDGSKITDLVKLNVVDSSIDNTVTPPVVGNGNNSNTGSNSNNIKNPDKGKGPGNVTNSTTNKLPNTGAPVGAGTLSVLGMLSSFVGTRLLKKKK